MLEPIMTVMTILLYLAMSSLLVFHLGCGGRDHAKLNKKRFIVIGSIAILMHAYLVSSSLFYSGQLDLSLFTVLSLIAWVVVCIFLILAWHEPIENLGIGILPLAIIALLLRSFSEQHMTLSHNLSIGLDTHIIISIIAYSLLSIAALQSILLFIQDRQLHNKHPAGFIRALPPLETMERLLFKLIAIGFVLLSISLVSGWFYIHDMLEQKLVHKTVLSIGAWLLFAILLWGRWRYGWRGRSAIKWTLTGFALLLLAYFGSKVVVELIFTAPNA